VWFEKGNRLSKGRPRGARNKRPAELAAAAREILDERFAQIVEKLLSSPNEKVVLDTLKWLLDRVCGKVPAVTVRDKIDTFEAGSPMALVMEMSGVPIPGRPTKP